MEEKIKAKFSDWTSTSKEGTDPVMTLPLKRGPEVKIVVEPGTAQSVTLNWVSPPDLQADTRVKRRTDIIEMLGFAVMNRRLEREARSANPPFINAGAGRNDYYHSANITSLEVNVPVGKWKEGLAAAVAEERRITQFGVTKAEMDREVEALRTSLRNLESPPWPTRKIARAWPDELVGTILEDGASSRPIPPRIWPCSKRT